MRALRLLVAAAGLAPAGGAGGAAVLQLLEASGAADGHALAAGALCSPEPGRGAEVLLVANRYAGTVAVLAGPTPHLNATLYGVIPPENSTEFVSARLWMTVATLEGGRATLLVARQRGSQDPVDGSWDGAAPVMLDAFVLEPNCSAATRVAQGSLPAAAPAAALAGLVALAPLGRSASAVAVTKSAAFRITQTGDRLQSKALTVPPSPWGHPAPALADHTWAVASDGGELLGAGSESLVLVGTNRTLQPVIVLAHVEPGDTLALNRSAPLAGFECYGKAHAPRTDRTAADRVSVS